MFFWKVFLVTAVLIIAIVAISDLLSRLFAKPLQ